MFYNNEELKEIAREAIKDLDYSWEVIEFDTSTGKLWGQYSHESVPGGGYGWVIYVFSEDPESLDARDFTNYMNRFDEPEYLGRMVL